MKKVMKCAGCGTIFTTKNAVQRYCNRSIKKECKLCHKVFETTCSSGAPEYCSRACAGKAMKFKEYVCVRCGSKFHPNSSRQKYCKRVEHKKCIICGKDFEYKCSNTIPNTCGDKTCLNKYRKMNSVKYYQSTTRICEWCGKEFHPVNNTQKFCTAKHYRKCEVCGEMFEVDVTKGNDIPHTCSKECMLALRFKDGNPFSNIVSREKAKRTCLEKYGVEHPAQSESIRNKMWATYKDNTGFSHPSHNPDVRSKQAKHLVGGSKFERRVENLLQQYNINYYLHHMINSKGLSHEFDFYLPDYKILIDCDGIYYHSYLSDPDGSHVLDYYDEDRIALIPEDHIFHVIVEGQEEKDIKYLVDIMKSIDSNIFDYESELFKWCRSIEFPYPVYSEDRLRDDYERLCKYSKNSYSPYSRLGDSIIQQFHHSIYDAHVGDYVSPVEAWYDDRLLKKVILNRLIYKNEVDPFKILKGFNISKICPRVSVFNPILAKYLITTYLDEFDSIFDPFSGFSGRLLGAASCGKIYVGQDLNEIAVNESNEIIGFLNLNNVSVNRKNILDSEGNYPCLLTCPPYGSKEHYNSETIYKSCDDWITEILERFTCKKYVFVVDTTEKYLDYVTEEISSTSHFVKLKERVIVIDN